MPENIHLLADIHADHGDLLERWMTDSAGLPPLNSLTKVKHRTMCLVLALHQLLFVNLGWLDVMMKGGPLAT